MPDFVCIFQCSSVFPCIRFFFSILLLLLCSMFLLLFEWDLCFQHCGQSILSLFKKKDLEEMEAHFFAIRSATLTVSTFLPHGFTNLASLNTISKCYNIFFSKNLRWVFGSLHVHLMGILLTIIEQRTCCC